MQRKKVMIVVGIFLFTLFGLFVQSALSAEIHGEVRLSDNTPVADAEVTAWTSDYLNYAMGYTDQNGQFVVSGTTWTTGIWKVQAFPPVGDTYKAYSSSEKRTVILASANDIITLPVPLFLETPNVMGRVLLPDGTPANLARVHIKSDNNNPADDQPDYYTKKDGYINLNIPLGEYELDIEPPEDTPTAGWIKDYWIEITPSTTVIDLQDITLPLYYKKIFGTVKTADGTVVSGLEVFAENSDKEIYRYGETDSSGKYEIWVSGGEWQVYVYQEKTSTWVVPNAQEVTFAEDDTNEISQIDITLLKPDGYLTGKVVDSSGTPAGYGVVVEAFNVETGSEYSIYLKKTGEFSFPLLAGPYEVSIHLDPNIYSDLAAPVLESVRIETETKDLGTITLLPREITIKGVVKDEQGTGFPGIFVDAFDSEGRWFSGITGDDGSYEIKVAPGEWAITLFIPENMPYLYTGLPQRIRVENQEEKTLNDIVLEKMADTVIATIRDESGNKVTDMEAWAYARHLDEKEPFIYKWVEKGKFIMNLPEGSFYIGINLAPNTAYTFTKEVVTGQQQIKSNIKLVGSSLRLEPTPRAEKSVTLQVKKNDAVIQGNVIDGGGNPISGVYGRVLATLRNNYTSLQISDINPIDGGFKISVSEGTWDLSYELDTDRYVPAADRPVPIDAKSGETVTKNFTLKPLGGIVRGQVLNPDGQPVSNIQTWLRIPWTGENGENVYEHMVFTDNDGKFIFSVPVEDSTGPKRKAKIGTALKKLEENISSQARAGFRTSRASSSQNTESTSGSRQAAGEVILKLREADTYLIGKVVDETNQPVENAFVFAYSEDGQKTDGYTDATGSYELFVARADTDGSNIWKLSADYKQRDGNNYYRSDEAEADISGTDEKITVSDLSLKSMGTLPQEISDTFRVKSGWCNLLSDDMEIYIPEDAVFIQERKDYLITDQVDMVDKIKIVIEPGVSGFPDNAEDYLIDYGYSIVMYEEESGRMILKKADNDIMLSLPYSADDLTRLGIADEDIRPAYFLDSSSSWQPVKGATIDKENKRINFKTRYLSSKWALVVKRETDELVLSVTPDFQNVSQESGSISFEISNTGNGTMAWTASTSDSWLKITDGASGTDTGTVTVSYKENTGEARTGNIIITAEGATYSPKTIEIRQAGASASGAVLSVSPTSGEVGLESGSITFEVSNTGDESMAWTASTSDTWLKITDGTSGTDTGTITVGYEENTGEARTGTIVITAEGATDSPKTIEIRQAGIVQSAITNSATSVTSNSAILNGTVNPDGTLATYYFEYGATTDYGLVSPQTDAGSGYDNISVQHTLENLDVGVTYYFRLVVKKSDEIFYGEAQNFTTLQCLSGTYAPAAGCDDSTAIPMESSMFVAWATGWIEPVQYGTNVSYDWRTPEKAVGSATGVSSDVVSLGKGGSITMTFKYPITNGVGWDFAVFENAISDTYLELAYVEVSSNGKDFVRFDSDSLTDDGFGKVEPININGMAGKYRIGYGTPFDLESLTDKNEVLNGIVDIKNITHVRIIDIVSGEATDTSGHIIYDTYSTSTNRAGFDLDAIGVIHQNVISVMPGDIDGNGLIELRDAVLALQICAQVPTASTIYTDADVNGDGEIGLEEVLYILRIILE